GHHTPAAASDRAAWSRAHLPDRAAVPQDDGAGERGGRRAVFRGRQQRARRVRGSAPATRIYRPCRPDRATGRNAYLGAAQASGARQELGYEAAPAHARRGQCRSQCGRNCGSARANPRDRKPRRHHYRDRASDAGRPFDLAPFGRVAPWATDRPGSAAPGRQRWTCDRGLSRLKICGRQSGACFVTNTAPKLRVSHLQAGYGDVQVLWDVTLEVASGELVCLIGSNGAGKTTLMRCISGLLPIKAGEIAVSGVMMARATPADFVGRGVAHVPEGRRLFSAMSVRDNLLMGAYLREDKNAIAADLERVYTMFPILSERQRQDAGTLAGGEQQMCAIGRGLMARPSLLLIDELSLGLAPRMVELLTERLREINKSGVAVLLVEQDVMNALELADRAYLIDHGRVTKHGPAASLANDPAIREAHMGIA